MKRLFFLASSVAFCLQAADALAADVIPAPAAPPPIASLPPVPSFTWSGFYVGLNAGWGWVSGNSTATLSNQFIGVVTATSSGNANGAIGGGQIGANWQAGGLVVGVEADIQASDQSSTTTDSCGAGCTLTGVSKVDWFGTGRVRVGAAFDRVLVYATGGAALTSASDSVTASGFGITANIVSLSATKVGWTAGAGVEVAVFDNWTARLEYLYISTSQLGTSGPLTPLLGGGTVTESTDLKDSIVRFGVNYKFGGGPGVARY